MKKKILDIFNFNTIVPIPTQFKKDLTIDFNAIKKHIYLLKKKKCIPFLPGSIS